MKKKHIIIIILAVLVLAGLFTIYKLPVKDSEAIDLDSDEFNRIAIYRRKSISKD